MTAMTNIIFRDLIHTLIGFTLLGFAAIGIYAFYVWAIYGFAAWRCRRASEKYNEDYEKMVRDRRRIAKIIEWRDFYEQWAPIIHHKKRPDGWIPPRGRKRRAATGNGQLATADGQQPTANKEQPTSKFTANDNGDDNVSQAEKAALLDGIEATK
jgi:hypothetical protein